ncbi:hypothetical protein RB195_011830 [Necator americanus]|uniref:Uncharacterized protein n=1 Tax=Necator americanus TaxID=51031 RepID=A0ABR1D478_NECAM
MRLLLRRTAKEALFEKSNHYSIIFYGHAKRALQEISSRHYQALGVHVYMPSTTLDLREECRACRVAPSPVGYPLDIATLFARFNTRGTQDEQCLR